MNIGFLPPGAPIPPDRKLEMPCEAISRAALMLVEAVIDEYPQQAESIRSGVNILILTDDGIGDHLFRLVAL